MSTLQIAFLIFLSVFMFRFFYNFKILYLTKDNKFYYNQLPKIIIPFIILFAIAAILNKTQKFQFPEFSNIWTFLMVFIIPLILTLLIKTDPGWRLLQIGKRSWQTEIDFKNDYKNGKIINNATKYASYQGVIRGEKLIKKSIDLAEASNIDKTVAIANKALAHQELGFLYRVINKLDKAENHYNQGLDYLEGLSNSEKKVTEVYREIYFRLAELFHAKKNYHSAVEYYKKSLECDKLLGHDEPMEEQITMELLKDVEIKLNQE